MHSSPRRKKSLIASSSTSPNMDDLSWLAELPLDVKVHIIMYAARAANSPVLGMAVNKLCRKTMIQQQPGLKPQATSLPCAVLLFQSSELKQRQLPLSLDVAPESKKVAHAKPQTVPDNAKMCLTMVTKLSLDSITSRKHQTYLQHFTMLQHLNIRACVLGPMNLAAFAHLKSFGCDSCHIESLLVTGNVALEDINMHSCKVRSVINVQDCPRLKHIDMVRCEVADRVRVNGCHRLDVVECSRFCKLPTLDISQCNQLAKVCLYQSVISKSLCISKCLNWTEMHMHRNSLIEGLDIFKLQQLKELHCTDCKWLLELRLPPSLVVLDCQGRPKLRTINASGCSMLQQLDCKVCDSLEQLTVTGCQQLKSLDCEDCFGLRVLDLSCTPQLKQLVCYGCDDLKLMNLPTSLISLSCYPCIDMTELLNIMPPGLRCLGIQYTAKWRQLLRACPSLTRLNLHSTDCSETLKAGSTEVNIGPISYGTCDCVVCYNCTVGDSDEDDHASVAH